MELLIILLLIVLNGVLSMSEIALVSAKKSRLQYMARKGNKQAARALDLSNRPDRFLSAIQIGITLVGIFLGAYSGENITEDMQGILNRVTALQPYSHTLSFILVVLIITFFSLVLGELVPKQLGLAMPEKLAKAMAGPVHVFSVVTRPFVWLLSISTNLIIKAFNIKASDDEKITEEEIKSMIEEGTRHGEVQDVERDIVDRVFILGDTTIKSLMTYKSDIVWIDFSDEQEEIRQKVSANLHNVYPVAEGSLDQVMGTVGLKDLFTNLDKPGFSLRNCIHDPFYLPENTSAYDAIRQFRLNKTFHALVIDEYGSVEGIITVSDILESLVGEVSPADEEYQIISRDNGTWLVDGQYPFHEFLNYFDLQELYEENRFNTIAGLILDQLGYIPKAGDKTDWMGFRFEIMDMDRARIDKVLVSKEKP
ncbi:MAG: HlyC/CorC family transporter [Bacteroidales bacterium]|nr:HlyC/CorC family transporter [Bacteroidales bacterium]